MRVRYCAEGESGRGRGVDGSVCVTSSIMDLGVDGGGEHQAEQELERNTDHDHDLQDARHAAVSYLQTKTHSSNQSRRT